MQVRIMCLFVRLKIVSYARPAKLEHILMAAFLGESRLATKRARVTCCHIYLLEKDSVSRNCFVSRALVINFTFKKVFVHVTIIAW